MDMAQYGIHQLEGSHSQKIWITPSERERNLLNTILER